MATLFTDYFKKEYKASAFSKSAVICYLFMVIAFIMPLVLVIKTHSTNLSNIDNIYRFLGAIQDSL